MTTPNNQDPAADIRHHHEELKRELAEIDKQFCGCAHTDGGIVHLDEGYRWRCEDCGLTREVDFYRPRKEAQ